MVQSDAGDYRKVRSYDVRAVKTATETDLYDGDINLLIGKPFERHTGRDLEKGQAQGIHVGLVTAKKVIDIFLGHKFRTSIRTGDPHALPEIHDVRRGVEPDLEAAGCQRRSEHIRGRAFAVRSGDVYRSQAIVRIAKDFLEPEHILKSGFVSILERNFLNRGESGEYRLYLFLITLFGKWFHHHPMYLFF